MSTTHVIVIFMHWCQIRLKGNSCYSKWMRCCVLLLIQFRPIKSSHLNSESDTRPWSHLYYLESWNQKYLVTACIWVDQQVENIGQLFTAQYTSNNRDDDGNVRTMCYLCIVVQCVYLQNVWMHPYTSVFVCECHIPIKKFSIDLLESLIFGFLLSFLNAFVCQHYYYCHAQVVFF